jgi:hypothetical protein
MRLVQPLEQKSKPRPRASTGEIAYALSAAHYQSIVGRPSSTWLYWEMLQELLEAATIVQDTSSALVFNASAQEDLYEKVHWFWKQFARGNTGGWRLAMGALDQLVEVLSLQERLGTRMPVQRMSFRTCWLDPLL